MKKHTRIMIATSIALFTSFQAKAAIIDSYFGWNYVNAEVDLGNGNGPINPDALTLNSISYEGDSGNQTLAMPDFFGNGRAELPDGIGQIDNPTYTTATGGDGETTRTIGTTLPIDWIPAGVTTSWNAVYDFSTIRITGITVLGVDGAMYSSAPYVIGLIPAGSGTELDSAFTGLQGDIYDPTNVRTFYATDFVYPAYAFGDFTFSAAVVPVPAAVWLFGSGLLGLAGIARRHRR